MKKFLFIILSITSPLLADEIYLVNNSVDKGTIINITGDFIEYKTPKKTSVKISRQEVEKIRYTDGREFEFYDKIYLTDNSVTKGRVIKAGDDFLEYNPVGSIPYDRVEISKIDKVVYDSGKIQNYRKAVETDLIYFKDGRIVKARDIVISNGKNIEFYDERNIKLYYGLNMIEKIVYKDGRTEYTDKTLQGNTLNSDKGEQGKPVEGFFEFEWGWNGYVGLGARLDYPIFDHVSINGGVGLGLWGYRLSGAIRFYPEYPYGWAFSAGFAYNTGEKYKEKLTTQDPMDDDTFNEKVKYTLKPVTCLNASIIYSIQVNGNNRIYFEGGYSYAFKKPEYTYTTESGRKLTDDSKDYFNLRAPGGIILTVGYAFAF